MPFFWQVMAFSHSTGTPFSRQSMLRRKWSWGVTST